MSSSEFRQIAARGDENKAERMFRAAVSAFCSLTRPTRRDAAQLDDLTLPLYDQVTIEGRRFVAAALSECALAPPELVRRLASEPLEVSAPLLMRSPMLTDVDLVALIAREGIGHAGAIAGRPGLQPAIARLIRALEAAAPQASQSNAAEPIPDHGQRKVMPAMNGQVDMPHPRPGSAADLARSRLRAMMAVGGEVQPPLPDLVVEPDPGVYARLRDSALTGIPALFQTALADAAQIAFAQAAPLVLPSSRRSLMLVLKGLGLGPEQAFLLVTAIDPASHRHAETVRLFIEHYSATHAEAGRDEIRALRAESIAQVVRRPATAPAGFGSPERLLRAS